MLKESDRILDMSFSRTLSALLGHLPKSRQTLLFFAIQTQSVSDLARLSLQDSVFISGIEEQDYDFEDRRCSLDDRRKYTPRTPG